MPPRRKAVTTPGAISGAFALASAERSYEGVSAAIATALAAQLREILPADGYRVDVTGPVLDIKWGVASSWTGILGIQLLEPGTADEKLTRVFQLAAEGFRKVITAAHREECPSGQFEPRVDIAADAIHLWWGSADAADAIVRFRPIPRSELGL